MHCYGKTRKTRKKRVRLAVAAEERGGIKAALERSEKGQRRRRKKMMRESRGAEAVHHREPERQRISKGGLILSSYPVTNLAPDI